MEIKKLYWHYDYFIRNPDDIKKEDILFDLKNEVTIAGNKYLVTREDGDMTRPCNYITYTLYKNGRKVMQHGDRECLRSNWSGSMCSYATACGWRTPVDVTDIIYPQ